MPVRLIGAGCCQPAGHTGLAAGETPERTAQSSRTVQGSASRPDLTGLEAFRRKRKAFFLRYRGLQSPAD